MACVSDLWQRMVLECDLEVLIHSASTMMTMTSLSLNRVLKCDVTKKIVKLWDLVPFSNRASLKSVLVKNCLLIVISNRNIKDESFILPHINLSNFESFPK